MRTLAVRTAEIQRLFSGLSFTIQPCPIIYCSDHPILPCHSILHLLLLLLYLYYLSLLFNSLIINLRHFSSFSSFLVSFLPSSFLPPFLLRLLPQSPFPPSPNLSLLLGFSRKAGLKACLALSGPLLCLPPIYRYIALSRSRAGPTLALARCRLLSPPTRLPTRARGCAIAIYIV